MTGTAQKVFLAVPAHSGDILSSTFVCVVQFAVEAARRGIDVVLHCRKGDSLIPNARNILFAEFLASDCTDFLTLDADISGPVDHFFRLISHPVDFVGGGYRFKRDEEDYPMEWLPKSELWADPENGLIEVAGIPTGFLRVTRRAAEMLVEANGDRWYRSAREPDLIIHNLFELIVENHQLRGEDYAFCQKWRAIGGKVWLDPHIRLNHCGPKEFEGDIGYWLKHRNDPETKDREAGKRLEILQRAFAAPEMQKLFGDALGEAA